MTSSPISRRILVNFGVAVASIACFLLVAEITLRLAGFSYVLYPEKIQFGAPDPVAMAIDFQDDPDLLWVEHTYHEKLLRLQDSQPGLLFLGDSCTHLGRFDRYLVTIAREHLGLALRTGNLAVPGWSSYQGMRQLERDVPGLGARVIAIYFGWNDHWIGFGIEDKNVARVKRVFGSRWSRLRLVQLATKGMVAWGARQGAYPERVSLTDFRANLRAMVERSRALGAVPLLLTAPSSHRVGQEPSNLSQRWLRDLSDLVPLHQAYVGVVRDVAAETGAPLCDLHARLAELPFERQNQILLDDGIHLRAPLGDAQVAQWLFDCLDQAGLWTALGAVGPRATASDAAAPAGQSTPGEAP